MILSGNYIIRLKRPGMELEVSSSGGNPKKQLTKPYYGLTYTNMITGMTSNDDASHFQCYKISV